ncbi:hypothetical protein GCM10027038_15790 [Arthrobacter bambusae]
MHEGPGCGAERRLLLYLIKADLLLWRFFWAQGEIGIEDFETKDVSVSVQINHNLAVPARKVNGAKLAY